MDAAGSCPRELMECDKKFVYDMLAEKDVFDTQYHAFWSGGDGKPHFDNRDPEQCWIYRSSGIQICWILRSAGSPKRSEANNFSKLRKIAKKCEIAKKFLSLLNVSQ
jgi:hypothetical protein